MTVDLAWPALDPIQGATSVDHHGQGLGRGAEAEADEVVADTDRLAGLQGQAYRLREEVGPGVMSLPEAGGARFCQPVLQGFDSSLVLLEHGGDRRPGGGLEGRAAAVDVVESEVYTRAIGYALACCNM